MVLGVIVWAMRDILCCGYARTGESLGFLMDLCFLTICTRHGILSALGPSVLGDLVSKADLDKTLILIIDPITSINRDINTRPHHRASNK